MIGIWHLRKNCFPCRDMIRVMAHSDHRCDVNFLMLPSSNHKSICSLRGKTVFQPLSRTFPLKGRVTFWYSTKNSVRIRNPAINIDNCVLCAQKYVKRFLLNAYRAALCALLIFSCPAIIRAKSQNLTDCRHERKLQADFHRSAKGEVAADR